MRPFAIFWDFSFWTERAIQSSVQSLILILTDSIEYHKKIVKVNPKEKHTKESIDHFFIILKDYKIPHKSSKFEV